MSRADFGMIDRSSRAMGVSSTDDSDPQANAISSATTAPTTKDTPGMTQDASQSPVSSILGASGGAGGMCSTMSGLCGAMNADNKAKDSEKAALAQKYPYKDCGLNPSVACLAYNKNIDALRANELNAWDSAKNTQLGAAIPVKDQQAFALTADMAIALKAKLPAGSGKMSLSQIAKAYPKEFGDAYATLQKQFPMLKNVPAELLLAMNPTAANMTLDELIAKAQALSGGAKSSVAPTGSSTGIAVLGAAALGILGVFFAFKKKQ